MPAAFRVVHDGRQINIRHIGIRVPARDLIESIGTRRRHVEIEFAIVGELLQAARIVIVQRNRYRRNALEAATIRPVRINPAFNQAQEGIDALPMNAAELRSDAVEFIQRIVRTLNRRNTENRRAQRILGKHMPHHHMSVPHIGRTNHLAVRGHVVPNRVAAPFLHIAMEPKPGALGNRPVLFRHVGIFNPRNNDVFVGREIGIILFRRHDGPHRPLLAEHDLGRLHTQRRGARQQRIQMRFIGIDIPRLREFPAARHHIAMTIHNRRLENIREIVRIDKGVVPVAHFNIEVNAPLRQGGRGVDHLVGRNKRNIVPVYVQ